MAPHRGSTHQELENDCQATAKPHRGRHRLEHVRIGPASRHVPPQNQREGVQAEGDREHGEPRHPRRPPPVRDRHEQQHDAEQVHQPHPGHVLRLEVPRLPGQAVLVGIQTRVHQWEQFCDPVPQEKVDLIYLCFPNNPTGSMVTKEQLRPWVEYARANKALILYDAAYVEFIRDDSLPHSIYEIDGAKDVAVEFRSLSKTAGFTGTRCAYTIVPKACRVYDRQGNAHALHALWDRRQSTKFNSVSYPVQRAAEAAFSPEGKAQVRELSDYYLGNAALIRETVSRLGYQCVGGQHSPYVWIKTDTDSWQFFDLLMQKAGVVCTPGSGFGKCGEGYVRLSSFNSRENVETALQRISAALGKA